MSGRPGSVRSRGLLNLAALVFLGLLCRACLATSAIAQERREREPNSVYAERRAKLAAHADGPIVLWGFTGREEVSQAYLFAQEENFYYLTGHNEEGAGLIILPTGQKAVVEWLQLAAPQAKLKDIRAQIGAIRQIKSPGEIAFLKQAIELSLDSHLEAMPLMRPELYEYQIA